MDATMTTSGEGEMRGGMHLTCYCCGMGVGL
jgi:hypothetical protein